MHRRLHQFHSIVTFSTPIRDRSGITAHIRDSRIPFTSIVAILSAPKHPTLNGVYQPYEVSWFLQQPSQTA